MCRLSSAGGRGRSAGTRVGGYRLVKSCGRQDGLTSWAWLWCGVISEPLWHKETRRWPWRGCPSSAGLATNGISLPLSTRRPGRRRPAGLSCPCQGSISHPQPRWFV